MGFSSLSLRVATAFALIALPMLAGAAAESAARKEKIILDAKTSDVDYKKNVAHFTDIVVSQGDIKVEADRAEAEATGLNFKTGVWTFSGNVRVHVEKRGNLHSDQAVIDFKDSQIEKATVTGKPAEFEQQRTGSGQVARGHANQITYEPGAGIVKLSNDAYITDGKNEIRGPLLTYNIRAQHVEAASQSDKDDRVHITINPNQEERPNK